MGREVQGRQQFSMQAVKWVVAKLQGDNTASFCREMSGREVTEIISAPVFHGTLLPMNVWTPSVFSELFGEKQAEVEEGLGGAGWRLAGAKIQHKKVPRKCVPLFHKGGIGKRVLNLWHRIPGRISSRQRPPSANPFSKLLKQGFSSETGGGIQ